MRESLHASTIFLMDWDDRRIEPLPESGLAVLDPWLIIAVKNNPLIRLDLRALDRITLADAPGAAILLVCADLEIGLDVVEGRAAAEGLVRDAAPHTREAIGRVSPVDASRILFVGHDAVRIRDGFVEIGDCAFRWDEVRDHALRGGTLPLPGGGLLQAAMALLAVAAFHRERSDRASPTT